MAKWCRNGAFPESRNDRERPCLHVSHRRGHRPLGASRQGRCRGRRPLPHRPALGRPPGNLRRRHQPHCPAPRHRGRRGGSRRDRRPGHGPRHHHRRLLAQGQAGAGRSGGRLQRHRQPARRHRRPARRVDSQEHAGTHRHRLHHVRPRLHVERHLRRRPGRGRWPCAHLPRAQELAQLRGGATTKAAPTPAATCPARRPCTPFGARRPATARRCNLPSTAASTARTTT